MFRLKQVILVFHTISHENWQYFNNRMNEKRSQEYQSMDPEYVTGRINSRILELLLRRYCSLIIKPSRKSQYALV